VARLFRTTLRKLLRWFSRKINKLKNSWMINVKVCLKLFIITANLGQCKVNTIKMRVTKRRVKS